MGKRSRVGLAFAAFALAACSAFPGGCAYFSGSVSGPRASYAVVVDAGLYSDPAWRKVVDTLRGKRGADLILYDGEVSSVREPLASIHPKYTCFVADWRRADEDFIVSVHRLTRSLDDDPYTDTIWGVLTGYDASDALRIASLEKPLIVRRVLSGSDHFNLNNCEEGIKFSEGRAGGRWIKRPGGKVVFDGSASSDSTKDLVGAMNDFKPDVFYTSGHGNISSWQIGYNYRDGFFFSHDGGLAGVDTRMKRHPIHSPNTKVYLPCGNCLIGRVQNRDAFALAMIHSAGTAQMFGYIVPTFNGFMGWGVDVYFSGMRNRYTLSESFFNAEQALIYALKSRYPKVLGIELPLFSERVAFAAANSAYPDTKGTKGAAGLLWDKNAVVFYGDPAWGAAYPDKAGGWSARISRGAGGRFIVSVVAERDGAWPARPVIVYLPTRVSDPKVIAGGECSPEITDDFVLLPLNGKFSKGEKVVVEFTANTLPERATSADSPPITVPRSEPVARGAYFDDSGPLAEMEWDGNAFSVPEAYIPSVRRALGKVVVGGTRRSLPGIFSKAAANGMAEEFAFIVANAPPEDLNLIPPGFILGNIALAKAAVKEVPWGFLIPKRVFLNYVVPYASLTETRTAWRSMLRKRLAGVIKGCATPGEAAERLNKKMWKILGVRYSRKRTRPDQAPEESVRSGMASCTGLSILLADACMAFGVPARVVGTPAWTRKAGNHTWVEVWDDGEWRFLGAYDGAGLDDAWFAEDAARADASDPSHAIYAVSFERTGLEFPCVWTPPWKHSFVSAVPRTAFYNALGGKRAPFKLFVSVVDGKGNRVPAKVVLRDASGAEVASGVASSEGKDSNDILSLGIPLGRLPGEYSLSVEYDGAKVSRKVSLGREDVAKGFKRITVEAR